ncbi:hypothetical protein DFJ74DRAFT_660151 [Hyaloraphidium curvatum]|nr:hypothetical protein DFJ74DRAFT_660151 [Hyaloraphidium curvatum]
MYWCESRAMEKTDRELQGAAWNVVRRSYLGDGPLSAFLGPWDGVLLAALDVPTMEHARTVQLVPQQVAVLRDAVVSRLELDCALWFLLAHACAYRSVRREVHDPLPADILSGLVLHLLAQPSHPQWKATFADPFDPRFWDHPCLRISPLVAWADMPHGSPERAASLALYKEGRIRTRSATPLATFWLRLQADELLAGLRRAGLTPADLGRSQFAVDDGSPHSSGSSENLHPPVDTAADLLALRDKVELAISDLHAQLPPDIQDAWERADLPAVIRAIVPIFGTRESAVTGVYCGIKLQTIRLEIRSPIGLLLLAPDPSFPDAAGPAPNDLDLPDPSTRWGRGLPPLLPDLLLSARLLSQLASLHPPTRIPTRRFLPPLLAISLLLASLFRRLRTLAAAGDPLPPGAWDAATHHLGLCLSALHGLVEKAPEHAVGVYGAVKAAVETGAVPRGGEAPVLAGEGLVQVLGAR